MPVTIEVNEDITKKYQDPNRKDGFAPLPLTKDTTAAILYHKVEAVSDKRSDTQHDPRVPWHDGPFVGLPPVVLRALERNPDYDGRIFINEQSANTDHGIIMHFHGHPIKEFNGAPAPGGFVHVDTRTGNIMTPQQASANAVITSRMPPKYRMWEFHLHGAIWTDGPARNARLMETAEQQRAHAQEEMSQSITEAFRAVAGNLGAQPQNVSELKAQNPASLIDQLRTQVESGAILPEQLDAAMGQAEDAIAHAEPAGKGGKRS